MQINRMEDLVPHKASLKALYNLEEFQPLQGFLNSLRLQKEAEIWQYSMNGLKEKTAEVYKTEISIMIAQRNLLAMLEQLPLAVQTIEDNIEKQKVQAEAFRKAQE